MPQCTAKAKSTGQRCGRDAVTGYNVCYVHGANPKNRGGGQIKHGLYAKAPGEKLKEAIVASEGLQGLEPELELMRSRLALFLQTMEGDTDMILGMETMEALSRVVGRIESLVKSIQGLKRLAEAGKPEGVIVIVEGMGTIVREFVPQSKWQEALASLERIVHGAADDTGT